MGRKKLERQDVESLFSTVSSMLVPEHILAYFEIWDAQEYKDRWVIEMREKEGFIPEELSEYQDIVFDGYCNPLEALSHSFVCKPIYLRLFRRRYDYQNHINSRDEIKNKLYQWYEQAKQLTEFQSVTKMIRKHETEILNFFGNGMTNAKAERLNGKMQRFISNNYGIKDKDFILYRIAKYFS